MKSNVLGVLVLALVAQVAPLAGVAAADSCLPLCNVPSTTFAYVPPVTVVESGSTVTWEATDGIPHTTTDPNVYCFHVDYNRESPGSVRFDVRDGALFATSDNGREKACTAADALPDGSFVQEYVCLLHPLMNGNVVVRPTA